MIRLLFDIQGMQNNSRDRGIGRSVLSLARALAKLPGEVELFLLANDLFGEKSDEIAKRLGGLVRPDRIVRFHGVGPTAEDFAENSVNTKISELLYEDFLERIAPDALLIGSLFEGAQDNSIVKVGSSPKPYVAAVVVHDLIPLLDPGKFLSYERTRDWYHRKLDSLENSDLLLAVSNSARSEPIEFLQVDPAQVVAIGSAASDIFIQGTGGSAPSEQAVRELLGRYGIGRPFLMHTSAFEERKNFEGLVRAFGLLPRAVQDSHQLVLVCKISDDGRSAMTDLARRCGLSPDAMILTGFVPDEDLAAFYCAAKLFVFPTFHEGFGLPPLEAMSCGTPAIGSNVSSIPEVIGRADALFDPHSPADMAALIAKTLTNDHFHASLVEHARTHSKLFSWDRTARAAITAIESCVARRRTAKPNPSPLDPAAFAKRFAARLGDAEPSSDLLRDVAVAYTCNEAEARRVRAMARPGEELTWRVEGPFDSSYSLALVNRELARALVQLGHRVVLHSTEGPGDFDADPGFLAANPDLAAMHRAVSSLPYAGCDVVSRNLYPPRVADMRGRLNALHNYAWEEGGFPMLWVQSFNDRLDLITCTSAHVEKVLVDNGVRVPTVVTGNGVDHWERVVPNPAFRLSARPFRFLHVSSCFPRKGVDVLLDAYGAAFTARDDVTLVIKTFENPHNEVRGMVDMRRRANPNYPDIVFNFDALDEADLKALYERCHVLVAPGKAEGYGLPLAEAMLSGLPVITTGWSGQLDFCNESNAWLVDYDFERADTHFALPASSWAKPRVGSLTEAMLAAFHTPADERARMAARGRGQLLADHKWADVAARTVEASRTAAAVSQARIGWLTSWNTRCGIGTYSEHLLAGVDRDVTVFGSYEHGRLRPDPPGCIRCWRAGKSHNDLDAVADHVERLGIDVVVVQFNYAFFNHRELARFIDRLSADDRAIVVMMHSTQDPVREMPGNELVLIADALARCDRLLVHSIADLNRLKAIGLVDNVALFPHGVLSAAGQPFRSDARGHPLVATYGFALPHKGLVELVEAAAILRDRGAPIRLRMINAEFPADVSRHTLGAIEKAVRDLELEKSFELHTEFLPDEQSLALLSQADLICYGYQQTGESASGAVRMGIAAKRPVAVTPLAIFDDLGDAVFKLPGTSAAAMSDGIQQILTSIGGGAEGAVATAANADTWRAQHDYSVLGARLASMADALAARRRRSCKSGTLRPLRATEKCAT